MKKIKRLLTWLLLLTMSASLLCIQSLADGNGDCYASLKEGTGYVALGDSYTRGHGCSDHWKDQNYTMDTYGNYNCRNVDGSYPNLIAEYFGLDAPDDIRNRDAKMWNLAKNAVSTAYTLDLLGIDDGYRDEIVYTHPGLSKRYKTDLAYFGDPASYNFEGTGLYGKTGEVMSIRRLLNDASLITIQLGQGDTMFKTANYDLAGLNLKDTAGLPSAVSKIVSNLYKYLEYWKSAYPLLLDYIKENNPDATVVCVGSMNSLQNLVISDDALIPIGNAINLVADLMNKYTRQFAEEYGYIYVDIFNVDSPISVNEVTLGEFFAMSDDEQDTVTHPTVEGYRQIARMIIAEVEKTLHNGTQTPRTYIGVDIGRFESVDYVAVNGKNIKNYTVKNHVLTVPYYTTLAKTLTVRVKGEDGKTAITTYSLSYNHGYSATRVYMNNDVENLIKKSLVDKLASAVRSIWNK